MSQQPSRNPTSTTASTVSLSSTATNSSTATLLPKVTIAFISLQDAARLIVTVRNPSRRLEAALPPRPPQHPSRRILKRPMRLSRPPTVSLEAHPLRPLRRTKRTSRRKARARQLMVPREPRLLAEVHLPLRPETGLQVGHRRELFVRDRALDPRQHSTYYVNRSTNTHFVIFCCRYFDV